MRIYFAGSIRGGRQYADVYAEVVKNMQLAGHTVLSEHVGNPELKETLSNRKIFMRDIEWLSQADVVIADVSLPSLGVGFELAYAAYELGIPVFCFAQASANVSAMITGNSLLNLSRYEITFDYVESVLSLLQEIDIPDEDERGDNGF
jgi:nucleoside 2-deoxyribosyltransferase